jgi:hypothetical protein
VLGTRCGTPVTRSGSGRRRSAAGCRPAGWSRRLLAGWPPAERREFARLICRFTSDIDQHLAELNR